MTTHNASGGPLHGLKVLDFGQYIAGPGAAMMLADQGADVLRIERPDGPAMETPANAVYNRGKRSVVLDLKTSDGKAAALRLVQSADVLVENFRPGVMDRLGLGYGDLARLNPGLVYLSLPGYRHDDAENAGIPAYEGVVAAAMGQYTDMGLNRVLLGIEASYSPLSLASAYASVFGVIAVVLAVRARRTTGQGDWIEAPLSAGLMEGLAYNSMWIDTCPERYKSLREREIERRRAAGLPMNLTYQDLQPFLDPFYRTYRCRDGRYFYVVAGSHVTHSERTLRVLGLWDEMLAAGIPQSDPYLPIRDWPNGEDCSLKAYPITEPWAGRLTKRMTEAFLTRDAADWERLFGEAGAPGAGHRTTREWLHSVHPRAAGLIIEVDDPRYGAMLQPGPVAWLQNCPPVAGLKPAPAPSETLEAVEGDFAGLPRAPAATLVPDAPAKPWLDGITVLDLTNVIAGPTIAGTLARFGARVIKIDPLAPTFDPWNTVVMGLYANRGKESALVDLKSPDGRVILEKLVREADVVTINAMSKQLAGLGLDYEALAQINPRVILCHIDAFGGPGTGPRSDYPGYDDLVQASTGIMERFGGSMESVEEHAHFGTIDVLGGLGAAFAVTLALLRRETTGRGDVARASLAAAGQWLQSRFMFDFEGRPPFDEPRGREAKGEGPAYRCYRASDAWFFLACRPSVLEAVLRDPGIAVAQASDPKATETALADLFATQPLAHWKSVLSQHDIALQPLESISGVRKASLGSTGSPRTVVFRREDQHPLGRAVEHVEPTAICPLRAPIVVKPAFEKYGASTRRLLAEAGFSESEISRLASIRAVSGQWTDVYLPE